MTITIAVLCVGFVLFLIRNSRTFSFRISMLNKIEELAEMDAEAGLPWEWRYDRLESVSFFEMTFSIKPLRPECWYKDTSFLRVEREMPYPTQGTIA